VERREASVPRHGTQGASQAPDTPRHGVSHGCSAEHPNVSRRSAHPSTGVSEAKRQSPDAAMRVRERDGLFDIVRFANARAVTPAWVVSAKAETHDHQPVFRGPGSPPALRASAGTTFGWIARRSAADFGQTNPSVILAKRSQAAAWARRTNLRVWGNERRLAFLFPACSLQGAMQLKGGSSTAPTRASLFATSSASPDPPFLTAQPRARGRAPTLQDPQITSSVLSSVSP
jgi:hypothetical protein